jgi:RNA polymerase sigma-70 factor, ECF subfamily
LAAQQLPQLNVRSRHQPGRAAPPHGRRPSDHAVDTTAMIYERELDPEALGDHTDRLYLTARGLCASREEAEDLVQETFARVLRRPRTLRADNDIGYLLRALRNTFLSTRRAASRRPRTEACSDHLESVEDRRAVRPEAGVEAAEVYAAISKLPDDLRDALGAIDVVGLSYREAAHALGAREATITTRLYRARQRVAHALLADDEATSCFSSSPSVAVRTLATDDIRSDTAAKRASRLCSRLRPRCCADAGRGEPLAPTALRPSSRYGHRGAFRGAQRFSA